MRRNSYPLAPLPELDTADMVYVNMTHIRAVRERLFARSVGTRIEFSNGDTLDCPLTTREVVRRLRAAALHEVPLS